MDSTATARPPAHRRSGLIVAGTLALLGAFVVPAQAGYYDEPYPVYRPVYRPIYPHYNGCSWCGGSRVVYERRYLEREYVERRYGWPAHHHTYRTWRPDPWGYGGVRVPYGYRYDPYARVVDPEPRPFPWGYGGVRDWRPPVAYRYDPYPEAPRWGYGNVRDWRAPYAAYEGPPRPPAPIWNVGDDY
jgi:hypothetical protein